MSRKKQEPFTNYTLEDCECCFCLYFTDKKKDCPLPVCACLREKQQAQAHKGVDRSE